MTFKIPWLKPGAIFAAATAPLVRAGILTLVAALGLMAQQAVVLDLSGSMAGFATPRDKRLQGAMERLGVLLAAQSPVKFYGMSTGSNKAPLLIEMGADAAGAKFANPASFRGGTPLIWTIEQFTKVRKSSDIVILTDAMEEGGQIERMADLLGQSIDDGWAIGLMSANLPFRGIYYTEQTIPKDFLDEVKKNVQAANPQWDVRSAPCTSEHNNCYQFEGERPLLALVMSKSGSLDRLFSRISESFSESRLPAWQRTQIAPLQSAQSGVTFTAPKATLAVMKLPDKPGAPFHCAVPENQAVVVKVVVSPGARAVEEPTVEQVIGFEVLEKPNWLHSVAPTLEAGTTHEVRLKCAKGGMFSSADLPGRLRIKYNLERRPVAGSWWTRLSAQNTWAYPFRVYKLEDLVLAAHKHALARYKPTSILLDQGQRTTN
jgi:hypothetical protein